MPVNYSVYMMQNRFRPEDPKKAYARAQIANEISLKQLSELVASQTTVSRADVSAVLIATTDNMLRELRNGNQVDFGDLGKFRLQLTSIGAESLEKFTANNIQDVTIQYIPGESLQSVFTGIEFNPVPTRAAARAVLKAQKAGQDTVDISKPSPSEPGHGGGGSSDGGGGSIDHGTDPGL